MSAPLHVVVVSGGSYRPSRTLVLAEAMVAELARQLPINAHVIELADIARPLGGALSRQELPASVEAELLQARIRLAAERAAPVLGRAGASLRQSA